MVYFLRIGGENMVLKSILFGVISGIVAADINLGVTFWVIIGCIMAAFVIISLISRRFVAPLLFLAVFMVAGYISGSMALNTDNSVFKNFVNTDIEVSGRISELPVKNGKNYIYIIDVIQLAQDKNTHKVNEKLRLTTNSEFDYGDVVKANGKLKAIPQNSNEFGFNSKIYYKSRGISYKMHSEECAKRDIKFKTYDLYSLTTYVRSEMYKTINKFYSGDDAALLSAITVGNKGDFSDDFEDLLKRTGVSRCLYPAFLQIMLFMSLMTLFQYVMPQKYRFLALSIFLLLFGVANSGNPIFVKSALYVALFNFTRQIFGFSLKQDSLLIVIASMLLANPLLIFDGGFVSSAVANILIIFFMKPLYKKLKFLHFSYLKNIVGISIICTLGLLPLSAYYFNGFALYQFLATLILLPLTAALFILSPILIIFLKLFSTAPLISTLVNALLYIYKGVPYLIDKLPFKYIVLPVPSIQMIIGFYMLVYALHLYIDKRKFYFPFICGIAVMLMVLAIQSNRVFTAEITYINVGQGDAALLSVPYRYNIIVDGGGGYDFGSETDDKKEESYSEYNIGEEVFVPYLQTHGKTKIDAALISHYHKDHAEGILAAIKYLKVKTVYMPDLLPDNEWRKDIEKAAKENGTHIEYITKDTTLLLDNGFIVDVIFPTKTALFTEDENNTTVVYKIHYGKTSALFTGDITSLYEASLVYKGKNLDCDILKVPHHGSANSTCSEFVKAASPQYAVISLGADNPYSFPRKEVLKNLEGIPIYRTDTHGDIRFTINRNGIRSIYTLYKPE